ncbi:MAG: polyamine aminopropyltransferase [Planctomycetes bacterium]|nr:polyamine aminopropyltransferase [Planctomycetota bacterium]
MKPRLVYVTVFVIAACGLGYELVAGSLASYLLGDSITQFSTAIGLYLFALGIGSFLSRFIERRLAERFIDIELAVAFAGGTSAAVLFIAFGNGAWFRPILYFEIVCVGTLVGLEIPLLMRMLKDEIEFKDLVSQVLTLDYVGALVVSLIFPLLFVPKLGLIRSALILGVANAAVALWSTWVFRSRLAAPAWPRARAAAVLIVLIAGMFTSEQLTRLGESQIYADEIVFAKNTPYQRIVITQNTAGFQLFLNGALQFSSADEYRYHEALVHPAMAAAKNPRRILVLGGGDGLAVREILKYNDIERVTLVDIDPAMTDLAREFEPLRKLNNSSLLDPRVELVHDDAMQWVAEANRIFDVIVADFPDPSSFSIGKLYTTRLYEKARAILAPDGAMVVQATSPLFARRSYWCIIKTIEAAGFNVRPYHAFVPSFGEWGYALAAPREFPVPNSTIPGLRHLDGPSMSALFQLPPDLGPIDAEPNRLNNQILVHYYEQEWHRWN